MSGQLRIRLYRRVATIEGFPAEVTLLDVPLMADQMTKRDDASLDRLEEMVLAKIDGDSG